MTYIRKETLKTIKQQVCAPSVEPPSKLFRKKETGNQAERWGEWKEKQKEEHKQTDRQNKWTDGHANGRTGEEANR